MDHLKISALPPPDSSRQVQYGALARLVGAIGTDSLGPALAAYLHNLCGADHFAAFHIDAAELTEVAACCVEPAHTNRHIVDRYIGQGGWRLDPAMAAAQRNMEAPRPLLIQSDLAHSDYAPLRANMYPDISDRLLLCGSVGGSRFGLSVLREQAHGSFGSGAITMLADNAELLVALLGQHKRLGQPVDAGAALRSLPEIECCVAADATLPRREAEVCARILYGLSSAGIAIDLEVSEETVKTYRKRAYQRLHIGSERELLNWYLSLWSRQARV
ncbi:helix-turn-helix transcriptional regulator [Hydrogenophaga sp. YM1]|uniref:helix-turn-helix transcriptional regulator n=1 Tax=Hydrogenophaga sp. YM1 TaxID=2806262 RepID=UPI001958236D|nr:helix-turn-helix transcriptional regulator [Hydrogenophaga sp. YM1]QRR34009.1 helix-turn-helix transcriptional regulator [Hydrogenophaga sp. YM1]